MSAKIDKIDCLYLQLRKASRKCDQYYNEMIADLKIRMTQLHILYALSEKGEINIKDISHYLGMHRSTFVREANLLLKKGYISQKGKTDKSKRKNIYSLNDKGFDILKDSLKIWKDCQKDLIKSIKSPMKNDEKGENLLIGFKIALDNIRENLYT